LHCDDSAKSLNTLLDNILEQIEATSDIITRDLSIHEDLTYVEGVKRETAITMLQEDGSILLHNLGTIQQNLIETEQHVSYIENNSCHNAISAEMERKMEHIQNTLPAIRALIAELEASLGALLK
jgi:hypothetical protein